MYLTALEITIRDKLSVKLLKKIFANVFVFVWTTGKFVNFEILLLFE